MNLMVYSSYGIIWGNDTLVIFNFMNHSKKYIQFSFGHILSNISYLELLPWSYGVLWDFGILPNIWFDNKDTHIFWGMRCTNIEYLYLLVYTDFYWIVTWVIWTRFWLRWVFGTFVQFNLLLYRVLRIICSYGV